jgi:4-amino-4-deoxy-L-arabinose transferase-like glycosyltransferase
MQENSVEKNRIEKVKKFLKNPVSLSVIAIVIFALIIRLYYFYHTPGQTLWWDEAEYMSTAVHWAFNVPYNINPQRPPLFQALAAVFFSLGLGEVSVKLFLTLIPSVVLVYTLYLLGKEMYNSETGIIAAFLGAVSWTFLFWADRVQPDFLSMVFQVLAIFCMWKFWKKEKTRYIVLAGILSAIGFYFKVSGLIVPMVFMVFIAIKDRLAAFKNKNYYYYSAAFLLTLVPYFIWSFINFGKFLAFTTGYVTAPTDYPIGWYNLNFYYTLTGGLTFILFLAGIFIALKFLLYVDVLVKDKKKCFDSDLFGIVVLLFVSAFYIFYQRNTDDRWVFLWMPFIFFFIAKAVLWIYNKVSTKNILAAFAIAIILLGLCGYAQVSQATSLIDMKKDSYSPVRDAALWMKANSNRSDGVFSVSYTQTVYYTQDNVTTYSRIPQLPNSTEFDKMVLADKPRYIEWSIFEVHPTWTIQWLQGHLNKKDVTIVYGVASDTQGTQPALVVVSPDYTKFS